MAEAEAAVGPQHKVLQLGECAQLPPVPNAPHVQVLLGKAAALVGDAPRLSRVRHPPELLLDVLQVDATGTWCTYGVSSG